MRNKRKFDFYIPGFNPVIPDGIPVTPHALNLFLRRLPAERPAERCWLLDECRRTGLQSAYAHVAFNDPDGNKVAIKAHRLSFAYFTGPIPPGLLILHKCNNKSCVNPSHLYPGTDADNRRDRSAWEAAEAAAGRVTASARHAQRMREDAAWRRARRRCEAMPAASP